MIKLGKKERNLHIQYYINTAEAKGHCNKVMRIWTSRQKCEISVINMIFESWVMVNISNRFGVLNLAK
jgi:hypothetical protein